VARGTMLRDRFPAPGPLPGWLTEDDLGFYAGEFERTGFRGALNRYRNVDRDWQDLQPWRGAPIRVPSLFIGGEKDGPTSGGPGPSPASPTLCQTCGAATSSPDAVTGSSRSGPMRSTGSSWTG
jgi:pimeloyl-ACP methyl ester carboxylesterase